MIMSYVTIFSCKRLTRRVFQLSLNDLQYLFQVHDSAILFANLFPKPPQLSIDLHDHAPEHMHGQHLHQVLPTLESVPDSIRHEDRPPVTRIHDPDQLYELRIRPVEARVHYPYPDLLFSSPCVCPSQKYFAIP
jgi:hypothetical protein